MAVTIPVIPAEAVLQGTADGDIVAGATGSGFLTIADVDGALDLATARETLLGFFTAGPEARARTLRHRYDPARPNVYRGHFPPRPEKNEMVDGFDLGPDIADPARAGDGADPLTEPTPRPGLPGWDAAAARYYTAMERLGMALTRPLFAAVGADPGMAERIFSGSISTLRMLRYPAHAAASFGPDRRLETPEGTRFVMTGAHTDSGFVTLLWQDTTGGLQAQGADGEWVDVPPAPGGLVVNFGQMLGDWSGGRIKATPHRVLGGLAERHSVPFFFEPAVDAVIEPLGAGAPFVYGDFLWERMQRFPNMRGLVRKPARSA